MMFIINWLFIKTFLNARPRINSEEPYDFTDNVWDVKSYNAFHSKFIEFFPNFILFFMLLALTASIFVLWAKNPIYSLLSLITVFFSVIMILLILNVEFLSLIFLIIYIGAIAILFLFVIMMFNLKQLQSREIPIWVSYNICFYSILFPKMYYIIYKEIYNLLNKAYVESWGNVLTTQFYTPSLTNYYSMLNNDILVFSHLLYVFYGYLLMLTGLILLTAMIGSIILALSTIEKN